MCCARLPDMNARRWPTWAGKVLRAALCVALLAGLLCRVDGPTLRDAGRDALAHPGWLVAGTLLALGGLLMAALRWAGILRAQGFTLSAGHIIRMFFIGQFFNAFMLGACGGDMARIYYTIRASVRLRTEAATTVLIDRGIGLILQMVFGCVLTLVYWPLFRATTTGRAAAVLMFAGLAGAAAGLPLLLRWNLFERLAFLQRLAERTLLGQRLRRVYETVFAYHRQPRALAEAAVFSLLNLLFQIAACAALGRSLAMDVPLADFCAFFPAISVLTAIPLTPGSFGVREGLFVVLFRSVGVDGHRALLLSLLYYFSGLLWSLVGGVFFLGHSAAGSRSLRAELDSIRQGANQE